MASVYDALEKIEEARQRCTAAHGLDSMEQEIISELLGEALADLRRNVVVLELVDQHGLADRRSVLKNGTRCEHR
jgi:hypothetical protein